MKEQKYSVFLMNVGSCADRYCPGYGRPFSTQELFERCAGIPQLSGVDIVATPDLMQEKALVQQCVQETGLEVVSIAADTFTEEKWRQGSFSAPDPEVRAQAVEHGKAVMDWCDELGTDLLTLWLGQDGFDYIFQADYIQMREWLIEGIRELCDYRPDMRVGLEYKLKEPRTHSLVSTVGTTALTVQAIARENCGVILDYGHALLGQENPAESVAILKQFGDLLMHVHINDNFRYWDDDMIVGSVHCHEFMEFFYWLERTGYDGWITIDQFPYREDGRDAVAESAEWLELLRQKSLSVDADEIAEVLRQKDGVAASRLMRKLIGGTR
jgi:xylose isomerase